MHKKIIAAVLLCSSIIAQSAHAFVVFDPTNFVQNLITAVQAVETVAQEIQQYNQMVVQYTTMLKNLESLPDTLKKGLTSDIESALMEVTKSFSNNLLAAMKDIDPASKDAALEQDAILSLYYSVPKTPDEIGKMMGKVLNDGDMLNKLKDSQAVTRTRYERETEEINKVTNSQDASEKRRVKALKELNGEVDGMDEQSEMQALQLIAKQNALSQTQNEALIKSQQLLYADQKQKDLQTISDFERARQRRLARAKFAAEHPAQGLGKATWGGIMP